MEESMWPENGGIDVARKCGGRLWRAFDFLIQISKKNWAFGGKILDNLTIDGLVSGPNKLVAVGLDDMQIQVEDPLDEGYILGAVGWHLHNRQENILWDNKWNQGILDCVPDAFINAFTTLVKSIVNAPVSSLPQMFRFLPITNPSHPNLKRVQDSIQAKLMNETIVPCESFTSEKLFRKPHEVYKLLPSFRSILNAAKSQHVSFSTNIVSQGAYFLTSSLDEIEYHSILNFLRIRDLDPKWYVRCIASSNIVMGVSDDVYLQLLQKFFEDAIQLSQFAI
ncbi:DNA binding,ATP binding protein [Artemisia annua]|uniref:DNA binding,ATP binding protein n=1 Tax=Artemisia annua TaxID=35608 RepID=A0A2U1N7R5_ARTAN|nr:DNA binding,ATP binding protein [Artemisia annua]